MESLYNPYLPMLSATFGTDCFSIETFWILHMSLPVLPYLSSRRYFRGSGFVFSAATADHRHNIVPHDHSIAAPAYVLARDLSFRAL
jgi:hypothetical protein